MTGLIEAPGFALLRLSVLHSDKLCHHNLHAFNAIQHINGSIILTREAFRETGIERSRA